MIIVHKQGFTVADYHKQVKGADLDRRSTRGLVLSVQVRFDSFRAGSPLPLQAFIDPGADFTFFSLRWIAQQATRPLETPRFDSHHILREKTTIEIAGQLLKVPTGPRGARLGRQGAAPLGWEQSSVWDDAPVMNGYEDALLGRDFLYENDLLLLANFGEYWFSLLHPGDVENLRRRAQIIRAFDPQSPIEESEPSSTPTGASVPEPDP